MIRRIKEWFGIQTGQSVEKDEIMEALRHRAAHLTMNVTVVGCLITGAVIRIWFPEEHSLLIMAMIVALFIMITSSLIQAYYGVQQAEEELSQRRPLAGKYIIRRATGVFVAVYLFDYLLDVIVNRTEPGVSDLFGYGVNALIWSVVTSSSWYSKNKRKARSS
jgi:hypothetical protein